MLLRNLQNSPTKAIPVAMSLVVVGLSLIVIGIAWPKHSPVFMHAGTDWNDFVHGFVYGIAIVFELCGVALAASAASAKKA